MSTEPAPTESPEDLISKLVAVLGNTADRRRQLQLLRTWDSGLPQKDLDVFRPHRRGWMSTMRLIDMPDPAFRAFEAEMKVGRHSLARK